jgi:hypothetical protein
LDEFSFKSTVFKGGIAVGIRKSVWPYLLGFFEFRSSQAERDIVIKEKRIEYDAYKARWKDHFNMKEEDDEDFNPYVPFCVFFALEDPIISHLCWLDCEVMRVLPCVSNDTLHRPL